MMRRFWKSQQGLSLVEALVAAAILGIISAPIFGAFMVARSAQAESTGRAIAQSIARTQMEAAQRLAHDDWTALLSQPAAADPVYPDFTVTVEVIPHIINTREVLKTVTVTVSWTGAKQRTLYHQIATMMEKRS